MLPDVSDRARLSAFDIGCVVVGGIVGVGIFFTPAEVARRVDNLPQLFSAWALGGLVAALGALVFAELACRLPGNGGTWRYVRAAFGTRTALLFVWANGFVIQAGALGVIGLVLANHVDLAMHGEARLSANARLLLAGGSVLSLAALNALGLSVGRAAQNLFTVGKALALAALVALAVLAAGGTGEQGGQAVVAAEAVPRGWPLALAAAMLPVLFAFGGWQHGSYIAGIEQSPNHRCANAIPIHCIRECKSQRGDKQHIQFWSHAEVPKPYL